LFIYSSSVLLICFLIAEYTPQVGSSTGWLITLNMMLAYGFYLLVAFLALAVPMSLVAWLVTKSDSASVA